MCIHVYDVNFSISTKIRNFLPQYSFLFIILNKPSDTVTFFTCLLHKTFFTCLFHKTFFTCLLHKTFFTCLLHKTFFTCLLHKTFFTCLLHKTFFTCLRHKTFFTCLFHKTFFTCLFHKTFFVNALGFFSSLLRTKFGERKKHIFPTDIYMLCN